MLPGATDTGLWNGSWNAQSTTTSNKIDNVGNDQQSNNSNNSNLYADNRSKMSVSRCAQLIISSMIGPNYLFFESWITRNPGLLWVYLASYEPMSFQLMTNIIAPLRLDMWRENGEDALYLPTLLGRLWKCIVDYLMGRSESLLPLPA